MVIGRESLSRLYIATSTTQQMREGNVEGPTDHSHHGLISVRTKQNYKRS
jgi:hypothetical protein